MHFMEVRQGDHNEFNAICAHIHHHYEDAILSVHHGSNQIKAQAQHYTQCNQAQMAETHLMLESSIRERETQLVHEAREHVLRAENTAQSCIYAAEVTKRESHLLESAKLRAQNESHMQHAQQRVEQLLQSHELEVKQKEIQAAEGEAAKKRGERVATGTARFTRKSPQR